MNQGWPEPPSIRYTKTYTNKGMNINKLVTISMVLFSIILDKEALNHSVFIKKYLPALH